MPKLRSLSTEKIIPSARRLVKSLRDVGYDFVHAVADIVDNSLAAGATNVQVDLHFAGPDSWLRISDNGSGMSPKTLTEAMRFGSERTYAHNDLGKFGLGLKTASISQCRRLIVASCSDSPSSAMEVRCLDLDHIERTDQWEVLVLNPRDAGAEITNPLVSGSGTVVFWQFLDRVMAYSLPHGGRARAGLDTLAQQLIDHLGMVFHRFLAGEVRGRPRLAIFVNNQRVHPWDLFAQDLAETEILPGVEIDIRSGDTFGLVRFQPFVLPPERSFSSTEVFRRLAGPAKWNAQQGFYIYRANRMIQSGGWCRMRTPDEHAKLARACIDFFPELDPAFEVSVAKTRVTLPAPLRERLVPHVESWVRRAQTVYRAAGMKTSSEMARLGNHPTDKTRNLAVTPAMAKSELERAARNIGELKALRRIVSELEHVAPAVAAGLGWASTTRSQTAREWQPRLTKHA